MKANNPQEINRHSCGLPPSFKTVANYHLGHAKLIKTNYILCKECNQGKAVDYTEGSEQAANRDLIERWNNDN